MGVKILPNIEIKIIAPRKIVFIVDRWIVSGRLIIERGNQPQLKPLSFFMKQDRRADREAAKISYATLFGFLETESPARLQIW